MDMKLLERESLNESVTVSCLLSRFELPMDMKLLERELLLNGSVTVSCLLNGSVTVSCLSFVE